MSNPIANPTPETNALLAPKTNALLAHMKLHRGFYVLLPVIILLIVGLIHFVFYLTGRPPTDGPGVLIVYAYNSLACVLAIVLTVFVKSHATLNRKSIVGDTSANISDRVDLIVSRGYTFALIWLFLRYITQVA